VWLFTVAGSFGGLAAISFSCAVILAIKTVGMHNDQPLKRGENAGKQK